MKQFTLPVRLIALAAFESARIHGEDPADVFDDEKSSRARLIAIEAIHWIYPLASQISIGRHFSWQGSGKMLAIRMTNARLARWWKPEDVKAVFMKIAPHRDVREREAVVSVTEDMASRLASTPRQKLTATAARNLTGVLMGDPGCKSYRIMTDQRSN